MCNASAVESIWPALPGAGESRIVPPDSHEILKSLMVMANLSQILILSLWTFLASKTQWPFPSDLDFIRDLDFQKKASTGSTPYIINDVDC